MDEKSNPRKRSSGKKLEREFAEWMRENLGYQETKRRTLVKGKIADRAYEVDVLGEKYSPIWRFLQMFGVLVFGLASLAILMPTEFAWFGQTTEFVVTSLSPDLAGYSLIVVGLGAIILAQAGKKRHTTVAWVECKDTRTRVKRAQVQKFNSSAADVLNSKEAKWRPDVMIMVSRNGFDTDALNFARTYNITCYQSVGDGFEEAD